MSLRYNYVSLTKSTHRYLATSHVTVRTIEIKQFRNCFVSTKTAGNVFSCLFIYYY